MVSILQSHSAEHIGPFYILPVLPQARPHDTCWAVVQSASMLLTFYDLPSVAHYSCLIYSRLVHVTLQLVKVSISCQVHHREHLKQALEEDTKIKSFSLPSLCLRNLIKSNFPTSLLPAFFIEFAHRCSHSLIYLLEFRSFKALPDDIPPEQELSLHNTRVPIAKKKKHYSIGYSSSCKDISAFLSIICKSLKNMSMMFLH